MIEIAQGKLSEELFDNPKVMDSFSSMTDTADSLVQKVETSIIPSFDNIVTDKPVLNNTTSINRDYEDVTELDTSTTDNNYMNDNEDYSSSSNSCGGSINSTDYGYRC